VLNIKYGREVWSESGRRHGGSSGEVVGNVSVTVWEALDQSTVRRTPAYTESTIPNHSLDLNVFRSVKLISPVDQQRNYDPTLRLCRQSSDSLLNQRLHTRVLFLFNFSCPMPVAYPSPPPIRSRHLSRTPEGFGVSKRTEDYVPTPQRGFAGTGS
jgi:hypothetical protein